MSQNQYVTTLEKQLKTLNERIDAKIMSGQQYMEEARKHRMLLQKIRSQKKAISYQSISIIRITISL